jgi:hypothetical protein
MNDALHVNLFGRDQREALCEIEAHHVTEHAERARARAVLLFDSGFQNALQERVVLVVE